MRTLLLTFTLAAALLSSGCAFGKKKSSARIYEGDGPSISYSGEESAGGRLQTR